MKKQNIILFILILCNLPLFAQTPGGTMHASNWSPYGKIYFDEVIHADIVETDMGNPAAADILMNIKLEGPVTTEENEEGSFYLTIKTEKDQPNSSVQDYIQEFKFVVVTDEGFFEFGPEPQYEIRIMNSYSFQTVHDLTDEQRELLTYFSEALPPVVSNLPIIGNLYSISQSFYDTHKWRNSTEQDWVNIWKYDIKYDSYPILNPKCVEPPDCNFAREYKIKIPCEKIGNKGKVLLYIDHIGVKRDYPSYQTDLFALFQDRTFNVIDNGNSVYENYSQSHESYINEQFLEIPNVSAQLHVTAEVKNPNSNPMLELIFTPRSDEYYSLYLRNIDVALVYDKDASYITGFPRYYNYNNEEVSFTTLKQQSGNKALMSWLKTFVSFVPGVGFLLGLVDINNAYQTANESIGFLDNTATNWKQQRKYNFFQLPPLKNQGYPGKEQGCTIKIPIADEGTTLIPTEIDFSAELGWKNPGQGSGSQNIAYRITLDQQPEPSQPTTPTPDNMVFVQGGTFQMGSNEYSGEKPVHTVAVNDFYIGKYEVTHREYIEFLNSKGINSNGSYSGTEYVEMDHIYSTIGYRNGKFYFKGSSFANDENCPVMFVTWYGAEAYCKWKGARLPTEAEWEYAARGGNRSRGYTYSGSNDIDKVAWYLKNSGLVIHQGGQKQPNELGIYDMSGNVWEWCYDLYDKDYYSSSSRNNPTGPSSGWCRVLRGGFYYFFVPGYCYGYDCRVASRFGNDPNDGSDEVGFRIVRSVE